MGFLDFAIILLAIPIIGTSINDSWSALKEPRDALETPQVVDIHLGPAPPGDDWERLKERTAADVKFDHYNPEGHSLEKRKS